MCVCRCPRVTCPVSMYDSFLCVMDSDYYLNIHVPDRSCVIHVLKISVFDMRKRVHFFLFKLI